MEKRNVNLIRGKYAFKQRLRVLEPKVIASGALKNIKGDHPEYMDIINHFGIKPGDTHYIITQD